MEEKKTSLKMKKIIATLLVTVGLAVAAFCGVGLLSLAINTDAMDVDMEDWLQDKDYAESSTLAWHMLSDMREVVQYIGLQQTLEDQGVLDLQNPALVVQYVDGSIVTYTMADLVSMGEDRGIFVYDEDADDSVSYYDIVSDPATEELSEAYVQVLWSVMDAEDAAVDLGEDVWVVRQSRIDDAIAVAQKGGVTEHRDNFHEHMEVFLLNYLRRYYDFRRTLEVPGNLRYQITLVQGNRTETYTDVLTDENNGQLDLPDTWDAFYSYNSESRRVETTLPSSMREEPIWALKNWICGEYDSVAITFGIDADFLQYEDDYSTEAKSYAQYRNQVFVMVGTMAVCALMVLVGMVWLIPLCGRKDGVEDISLNLYDRIPTELGAFGILLLCMAVFLVLACARNILYWIMRTTVAADVQGWMLAAIAAALLILVYLILWLGLYGLIRRCKAHTFWKNSLCAIVLRWCMKPLGWCRNGLRWWGDKLKTGWNALLESGDVTWKTAAVFIGYLLINFFLFVMYRNHYDGFFFLLMLVFNALVGVYLILKSAERKRIRQGVTKIAAGNLEHHLALHNLTGEEKKLAEQINRISDGLKTAVEDSLKNERMKTELITNVSHDIKTPLTSIINYVDLLKRENIEDPKIQGYIEVLDQKSKRLKTLTEDLVEASKASSGTLKLSMEKIDFVELINQTNGEFTDRFAACNLSVVPSIPDGPAYIMADGRYVWRILENLYRNAEKYSMPGTRVYIEVFEKIGRVFFVMKNVSNAPLNFKADELTERFIRGDVSRTTEGSGLGLSIAKDMTELMNGTFRVYLDGDLFRVTVSFALVPNKKPDLKGMEENVRRRVAAEEKKIQAEMADVVSESGMAEAPVAQEDEDKKERCSFFLSRGKLPKVNLPKRKKKHAAEEDERS